MTIIQHYRGEHMNIRSSIKDLRIENNACNENKGIQPITLAIDCAGLLAPHLTPSLGQITHTSFAALTPAALESLAPNTVVIPLFGKAYDALHMVEALEKLGYTGCILAIAPALPNPAMAQSELRAAGPHHRLTLSSPEADRSTGTAPSARIASAPMRNDSSGAACEWVMPVSITSSG